MLKYGRRVWYSKFARSVAIVAGGTATAQIITLAFTPIITRLYGPEAFGILGAFTSLLAIMIPLAALSYPIAIVLPEDDRDAVGLAKLSIKLGFLTSSLLMLTLLFAKEPLLEWLNINALEGVIWFIPIAMLFSVLLAISTQWALRKKLFILKSKVAVVGATIQNSLKAFTGIFAPFAVVLIAITTVSQLINSFLLYRGIIEAEKAKPSVYTTPRPTLRQLALRHKDFAYFRTPQIVLNAASQSLPILMITALYGATEAGFYALGYMVLGAPVQLLGQSVHAVFYPHFNEAIIKKQSGLILLIKTTISLAAIGFWPFFIVILFGPPLFSFVFGLEWKIAGELAQWLSLWLFFSLLARPSIAAIPVLNIQGKFLMFEVLAVLIRFMSLYVAYSLEASIVSAVMYFTIANCFVYLSLVMWVIVSSYRSQRDTQCDHQEL